MVIKDKELSIRLAMPTDAPLLVKWWEDGHVMAHAGFPNGIKTDIKELEKKLSGDVDNKQRCIILVNDEPVGECCYEVISDSCDIGIKICETTHQEKGYGTRILRLLIEQLFEQETVSKIILTTNLENKRAMYVYEKIGFEKVRVDLDAWTNQVGQLQSVVYYELPKDRFMLQSK